LAEPMGGAMSTLKQMWDQATKEESEKVTELPLIVRMLWSDRFVFSKSVLRDWWVVQKNRHIFFSMLLSHTKHPFSRKERVCMVLALLMFGYFIAGGVSLIMRVSEDVAMSNLARNCTGCEVKFCTASSADADFAPPTEAAACDDARPICSSEADPGDANYCETPTGRQVWNTKWEEYQAFKTDEATYGVVLFFAVFVLQAAYDNLAKWSFVCYCGEMNWQEQRVKTICEKMGWGMGGFLLVLSVGLCIFMIYDMHPNSPQNADKVAIQCNTTVIPNASAVPEEMCDFSIMSTVRTFSSARFVSFCFTVTVVLTLKFFYKRSFGFKIKWCPPKVIWKRCGEWHKLEDKQNNPADFKDIVEHEGFPNYDEIRAMKYPGENPKNGDTEGAEIWPFSNVSLSCKCSRKQVAPS